MKKLFSFFVSLVFGLALFTAAPASAATPKSEAELVQKLYARDWHDVHAAVGDLIRFYPTNTDVIPLFKTMLHSNGLTANPEVTTTIQTKNGLKESSGSMVRNMPPMYLSRQAARALAAYHADMSDDDLQCVYRLLESTDIETKMDGLKALRGGFNAPDAVLHILPLLKDPNQHVVRDACRTLATIGDKSVVSSIEPLLKNSNAEISGDAQKAIFELNSK